MFRKWTLILATIIIGSLSLSAQDIAIVDINAILEDMEEYQEAQTELDRIAAEWRQEISQEYDKIKSLYNKYQAEQVLLSDEVRKQREDEIMEKEKAAQAMQRSKFGVEGELFRKRQELVNPVQDRVYGAIEEFAEARSIDIIFDKSSNAGLIFANEKFDRTEDIKKKLGL
jgi:outer membrane protein